MGLSPCGKCDLVGAAFHAVAAHDFCGQRFAVAFGVAQVHARQRAANQRRNVRMLRLVAAQRECLGAGVRPGANALACRDKQIIAVNRKRRRIPLGRNEVIGAIGVGLGVGPARFTQIEDGHGVGTGFCHVKRLAIVGLRQRDRVVSTIGLPRQAGVEVALDLAVRGRDYRYPVAIGQGDVEPAFDPGSAAWRWDATMDPSPLWAAGARSRARLFRSASRVRPHWSRSTTSTRPELPSLLATTV